jgi:UDP-N-acetylglucosamine 2-epimerase (non-hydrolysing)/GDP/UDP-N,N'-diacetylbacillosamine 2-epimerase (hydrolysing)
MREIGVVTVARSDFGIYLPLLRAIRAHSDLRLRILVSGMHLAPEFGLTVQEVEKAGFEVFERVESLVSSDTPAAVAKSIGLGVLGFAQVFSRYRPDILVLLGDRFDMLPAALAALPFRIPIAHLHGGELTEGVMDEEIRHSISKMSHLHFVAAEPYARRLRQLGEEDWRILVSGSPALDSIRLAELMSPEEVSTQFGIDAKSPALLVTYHPVTLESEDTERGTMNLLDALSKLGLPCLFTYPNADTHGRIIIERIEKFCMEHPKSRVVKTAGQRGYYSLMKTVSAMAGNSSSGIIEAASFELPVVNIGNRQKGRIQARNVINCGYQQDEISEAIRKALDPAFRAGLRGLVNPYGDGHAVERIVKRLAEVELGKGLLVKRFADLPSDRNSWEAPRS